MEQEDKQCKVATYTSVNQKKTDDGDRILSFNIYYRETSYYIEASFSNFNALFEDYDFHEIGADICRGLTKNKHSALLHHLLLESAISVFTSPLGKYDNYDNLPPKARNRMRETVSYLFNEALRIYLEEHKDTPNREDLWNTICNDMKHWSVRMLDESTITYSNGKILRKTTFDRQFNRKIGTTSFKKADFKDMKKFYTELEKKPVGRPRKHPPKKTHKPE